MVLVYVDDLLVAGNNHQEISKTIEFLSSHFHMKELGKIRYFLGLEIDQTEAGIFVSQAKYIQDILKEYGIYKLRSLKLPLDSHQKLTPDIGTPLENPDMY